MPPPVRVSEDFERFRRLHEKYQFGGLVLFNGHHEETPRALSALQSISKDPVLVAADIERGAGQQIEGLTLFPHAMACGKAGSEAVATFARVTAEEALSSGIHITFAPVADVNSNDQNPIIGIRAFGSQPQNVANHVKTYIDICRNVGLLTTAKHFPGHGDTATDSHAELPVVPKSRQAIEAIELPPFKTAVECGVDLVMTAHVAFPALDDSSKAATLSPSILNGLLRNQLGFEGAVISDSLIMKAIQPSDGDIAGFAANLLNAGLDILLDPIDPEAMVDGIVRAIKDGRLKESRLDDAVERVQALKSKLRKRFGNDFFINPTRSISANSTQRSALRSVQKSAYREAARKVAKQAIQQFDGSIAFPISKDATNFCKDKMAIFVTPYKTRLDALDAPIKEKLLQSFEGLDYRAVDVSATDRQLNQIVAAAKTASEVLLLVVSKPAAWHAYGLPDRLSSFATRITESAKTTLVSLGDPHILKRYPRAESRICTYSDVPASQYALVEYLR